MPEIDLSTRLVEFVFRIWIGIRIPYVIFQCVFLDFLMVPATSRPQIDILLICQGPMAKATALESPKPVSPRTDDKDHFHG